MNHIQVLNFKYTCCLCQLVCVKNWHTEKWLQRRPVAVQILQTFRCINQPQNTSTTCSWIEHELRRATQSCTRPGGAKGTDSCRFFIWESNAKYHKFSIKIKLVLEIKEFGLWDNGFQKSKLCWQQFGWMSIIFCVSQNSL